MPIFILGLVFLLIIVLSLDAGEMIVNQNIVPCTVLAKSSGKYATGVDCWRQYQALYHAWAISEHGQTR
jgi:hypothetical protein